MATVAATLSPLFPAYTSVVPDGLRPFVSNPGSVAGRLILQDGAQFDKDEFNMDRASVPFKIFAGSNWQTLLPTRGDVLSGFGNMQLWDPIGSLTVGKVWVELRVLARGLIATNGVGTTYTSFALNPTPVDSTGIGSAQISGTDGSSVMDIVFYRPQTVYRYVTTTEEATPPTTINNVYSSGNPTGRRPLVISYSVRGSNSAPDGSDDADTGAYTINGFNLGVRQRGIDLKSVQVGPYWQNESTVVYEYYDTAAAS